MRLSIVAPCYNEEDSLREFKRRASKASHLFVGDAHEIILIDDGSSDATWSIIEDLSKSDPYVDGVRLFRNHGHQLAVSTGCEHPKFLGRPDGCYHGSPRLRPKFVFCPG